MTEKEHRSKKRKSQSGGDEGVSNKKIKVTYNEPNGQQPVLVSAPGLQAPQIPFKAYAKPLSGKSSNADPRPSTHNILLHSDQ